MANIFQTSQLQSHSISPKFDLPNETIYRVCTNMSYTFFKVLFLNMNLTVCSFQYIYSRLSDNSRKWDSQHDITFNIVVRFCPQNINEKWYPTIIWFEKTLKDYESNLSGGNDIILSMHQFLQNSIRFTIYVR